MGLIGEDSRGQLFSLDLLFALIPLVLVLGMVASDMDNITYLVQDTVYRSSTDRVASDTLGTLLETSGQPNNWEQNNNSTSRIVGLAKCDANGNPIEGTISPAKLGAMSESDVQNIIGNNYGFYFTITSMDENTTLTNLSTNGLGLSTSASDIVRVERVVLYAKLDVVSQLKNDIRNTGTPRTYTSPPQPFQTNKVYLDAYDYYALIVNRGYTSGEVDINGQTAVSPNVFKGESTRYITLDPIPINESILKNGTNLQYNSVSVTTQSKPGASFDVYIIQAPRGTDPSEITLDNVKPKYSRAVLYLWTK